MYKEEQLIIYTQLTQELACVNTYIDKVESYTAITAPESTLGINIDEQKDSDFKLKQSYMRKRKIMFFLERISNIDSFLCINCRHIIDLERLLLMPKASFCGTCASQK